MNLKSVIVVNSIDVENALQTVKSAVIDIIPSFKDIPKAWKYMLGHDVNNLDRVLSKKRNKTTKENELHFPDKSVVVINSEEDNTYFRSAAIKYPGADLKLVVRKLDTGDIKVSMTRYVRD